jgi:hypothetical protein
MQDFTNFAMGQTVDGELIVVCPYCHRHAVKRENVGIRFVHSVGTVEVEDRIDILDSCPVLPANLPRPLVD